MAYVLGITRVDPIRHELLFERFINEGRTTYPDVDIDFCLARREEVIQYVYERYGAEHTGMVCNLVTYRARSAVREVGYALGFPRPLVDRVAKALETYDSVMVRRDLEAEGGFARVLRAAGREAAGASGAGGSGRDGRRGARPDRRDGPAAACARRPLPMPCPACRSRAAPIRATVSADRRNAATYATPGGGRRRFGPVGAGRAQGHVAPRRQIVRADGPSRDRLARYAPWP